MSSWPDAIKGIVIALCVTAAFMGWVDALPWQNRKKRDKDN